MGGSKGAAASACARTTGSMIERPHRVQPFHFRRRLGTAAAAATGFVTEEGAVAAVAVGVDDSLLCWLLVGGSDKGTSSSESDESTIADADEPAASVFTACLCFLFLFC